MTSVRGAAARAEQHPLVERGARLGFAASGVLHLLIGFLAVRLALGDQAEQADQSGALQVLAGTPGGAALLWVLAVGFGLLGLWLVLQALLGSDVGDRLKDAGKGVVHLVLAWLAASAAARGAAGGSGGGQGVTDRVMALPAGRVLVGLVGVGILAVAGYHVVKGVRATFLRDLEEHPGEWAERAGRVGYVAKGVALAAVGVLVALAAVRASGAQQPSLDAALHAVLALPAGAAAVGLVGLGFAAYGLYAFARARHARV